MLLHMKSPNHAKRSSAHARRRPNLTPTTKLTNTILRASIVGAFVALAMPRDAFGDILDQYTFGDSVPNATLAPTSVGANLTATLISADSGLALDLTSPATQPASAPYLRTTFITTSSSPTAAVANNADFKFTLTADAGYLLDLSSLTFDVMRGGASTPRGYDVRSSVDGFATSLGQADVGTARPAFTNVSIDLTSAAFQGLTTITFKIFSYSPATGSSVDYDNFVVNGSVVPQGFTGYTWKGGTSASWDTATANWTGLGSTYADGTATSDVLFDDSATAKSVTVTPSAVNPNSIRFTNATGNYTFSGNSIAVAKSLSKTGAATTTFNNAVSAATVQVSGGTLAVGATGTLTTPSLNVSATGALTVANGGVLGAATAIEGSGSITLNNTSQTIAALSGANTGVITLNGTALNVAGGGTYNGRITGSGSLVKSAGGTLSLGGANDFTGGVSINEGALQIAAATAGGAGPITVNSNAILALAVPVTSPVTPSTTPIVLAGGTLGTIGAQTLNSTLTVTSASTVDIFNPITNATGSDLIVTGMLQGSGDINLVSQNGTSPDGAAFRLRGPVSAGPNAYTGKITVGPSAKFELQTSDLTGSQMGSGTLVVEGGFTSTTNTGTYSLINVRNNSAGGAVSDVNFGNNVQVTGFGASYFNLLGSAGAGSAVNFGDLLIGDNQEIGAVATASAAFTLAFSTVHLTGGNATFTPQPVGNTSFVSVENISLGKITENVPGSGITMNGAAKLSLTGANSYTGPTTINSGTVVLNGSIAGSATSIKGGTLQGIGTAGAIALSGGTLAPGNGPGVLNSGSLTLEIGTLAIEIGGSTAENSLNGYDQLNVTGGVRFTDLINLVLDFNTYDPVDNVDRFVIINNDLADPVTFASPTARLFYEGKQLNEGAVFTATSGGFTQDFRVTYAGGTNSNDVVLIAVPEPSASVALLCGVIGLAGRRCPRRTAGRR